MGRYLEAQNTTLQNKEPCSSSCLFHNLTIPSPRRQFININPPVLGPWLARYPDWVIGWWRKAGVKALASSPGFLLNSYILVIPSTRPCGPRVQREWLGIEMSSINALVVCNDLLSQVEPSCFFGEHPIGDVLQARSLSSHGPGHSTAPHNFPATMQRSCQDSA